MLTALLGRFSLSGWFFEAWSELARYFYGMNATHYGILAACAVAFGFLCLRGSGINR
jgi:hypothetical protein